MNKKLIWAVWLFFLLASLIILWPLLSVSNLNFKYDWGFAVFDWTKTWHDSTTAWNDYFLGQAVGINTAWLPLMVMSGLGLLFNIPVALMLKGLILFTFWFGGVGMTWLLKNRGLKLGPAILGGLIYILSPTLFIRVVVGFVFYLIAIALVPWLLRGWFIAVEQRGQVWWGYLVPLLFAVITAQPQFAVMVSLIMIIDLLAAPNINYFKRSFGLLVLCWASALIIHLPWLLIVLSKGVTAAANINSLGSSFNTIASLPHSLIRTLIGADHHITFAWFDLMLTNRWFVFGVFGALLLAVVAPLVASRKREVRLFAAILAVSWPLALGPAEPTKEFFSFLYNSLPFTNLFREVYHWSYLIVLATVFLASFTLNHFWSKANRWWSKLIMTLIIFSLVYGYSIPFIKGGFSQYLGSVNVPESYRLITASHESEVDRTTRTLFLPPLGFIKFKEDQSPGATNNDIYALSTNRAQLPTESSTLDFPTSSNSLRAAVVMSLHAQDNYLAGFLRATAANNVIVRTDLESQFAELFAIPKEGAWAKRWQKVNYDSLLANQTGVNKGSSLPGINKYIITNTPTLISLATAPVTAAFDWRSLSRSDGDAVFYLEDMTTEQQQQTNNLAFIGSPQDKQAALMVKDNILPKANFEVGADLQNGWVRPSASWWFASSLAYTKEPYLFTKNGEQAGNLRFTVTRHEQPLKIWLKYWSSTYSGNIKVQANDWQQEITTLGSSEDGEWLWQEIELPAQPNNYELIITGSQAVGVAQVLLTNPAEIRNTAETETFEKTETFEEAETTKTVAAVQPPAAGANDLVIFTKSSPSHYNVKTILEQSRWLVFRMAYHKDWVLRYNNTELQPVPVNGYAMAFKIPAGQTEADLVFKPQTNYSIWQVFALGYLLTLLYFAERLKHKKSA